MEDKHFIHKQEPVPFCCDQCEHYIDGAKCRAFDIIPLYYFYEAEAHNKIDKDQKGDFIFKTKEKKQYNRVYVVE